MPEASKAQRRVMSELGIPIMKGVQMREAAYLIEKELGDDPTSNEFREATREYETKPRCTDCDKTLTPTEKLSLMPDGTTAGTTPKRPLCQHCADTNSTVNKNWNHLQ